MFVPTKSSLLKRQNEDSCETVVFKKRPSKKSVFSNVGDKIIEPIKKNDKMDIKKLRYEVIKFGTSGFDGSKKEESRVALAVALGAAPPKKKCKNYVQILAEKKAEKEKGEKTVKSSRKKNFKRKKRSGNKTSGLLNSYGKVKPNK